jgi:RNA polymerase sigma factor (sigma-70 family)
MHNNKINIEDHVNQMYSFFKEHGIKEEEIIQDLVSATVTRLLSTESYNPNKAAASTRVQQIMESVMSNYFLTAKRSQDALDQGTIPIESMINRMDDKVDWRLNLLKVINNSTSLTKTQKLIMTLKWSDGFYLREIGDRLGLTHDATRQQHRRAIEKLKEEYGDNEEAFVTSHQGLK